MVSPKTLSSDDFKGVDLPENAKAFLIELSNEFPQFSWRFGSRFKFKPEKTIYIDVKTGYPPLYFSLQTLHELGHALSGHKDYSTDVRRLKMESEAWEKARELTSEHKNWESKYGIYFDEEFSEAELDSYRDWLHTRSKCKKCGLTRYQTKDGKWHCPRCDHLLSPAP